MQMQELQIKQAEVQRKIAKDQADAAARMRQLEIEQERINAQKEIAGANMAVKVQSEKDKTDKQHELEGFKSALGVQQQRESRMHQSMQPKQQPPQKGKK
jgi:hypothetical protein